MASAVVKSDLAGLVCRTARAQDAINNNCIACHSADHLMNQPSLSRAAWQEVVNKMITAYKAPVSADDAKAIVDYLVRTKGAS